MISVTQYEKQLRWRLILEWKAAKDENEEDMAVGGVNTVEWKKKIHCKDPKYNGNGVDS